MMREVDIGGVYIAPFARDLFVALAAFMPIHFVLNRIGVERFVWHRSLFDLSLFVCLLGLVVLMIEGA